MGLAAKALAGNATLQEVHAALEGDPVHQPGDPMQQQALQEPMIEEDGVTAQQYTPVPNHGTNPSLPAQQSGAAERPPVKPLFHAPRSSLLLAQSLAASGAGKTLLLPFKSPASKETRLSRNLNPHHRKQPCTEPLLRV